MPGIPPAEAAIDWTQVIFKGLTIKGIYGREMFETWYKGDRAHPGRPRPHAHHCAPLRRRRLPEWVRVDGAGTVGEGCPELGAT
jgi:hypothetical protein